MRDAPVPPLAVPNFPPRDALLAEIEAEAEREGLDISAPEVGKLLSLLARSSGAKRIVELGTGLGYGTLCLARGAPEGRVLSIEREAPLLARARTHLERGGVAERVELVLGDLSELLPQLAPPIDLAVIDAEPTHYRRILDQLLPKITVGGLVLFGGVLATHEETSREARALGAFHTYLLLHPQLSAVILPVGGGLGLATKTRALMTELGGPW